MTKREWAFGCLCEWLCPCPCPFAKPFPSGSRFPFLWRTERECEFRFPFA